jgi:hypothetical protein
MILLIFEPVSAKAQDSHLSLQSLVYVADVTYARSFFILAHTSTTLIVQHACNVFYAPLSNVLEYATIGVARWFSERASRMS